MIAPCKTGGLVLACAVSLASLPAHADDDDQWFGRDKALHFSASAVIATGGYAGTRLCCSDDRRVALLVGGGLAAAAGLGKELLDLSGRGDPSWRDLTWDAVGAATGLVISWAIDRFLISPSPARPASP